MNKPKITFGKIQLNIPKKPASDETTEEKREEEEIGPKVPAEIPSTSGKRCVCLPGFFFFLSIRLIINQDFFQVLEHLAKMKKSNRKRKRINSMLRSKS